ncbi:YegP family protein [Lonsdalea britannica]|uniref:YegP family protein n=1 Tax=Lonsdalea britannica TaxID=1082704 RepID=UPI0026ED690E|nr:YegP family protein [Lonsdalea britannica]
MGHFVIKKSAKQTEQPYYFKLVASNGETIATSEMYASKQSAKKGIESVQKNGPTTDIRDETGA